MTEIAELLHYLTIALSVATSSIGAGIGEGIASSSAIQAINKQPGARGNIAKTMILGTALIETSAIMGLLISIIMLWGTRGVERTTYTGIATIGITLAICISGFISGIVSALPTQQACISIARQPFFSPYIIRFMLITQSIIQTPILFGFIVAMLIKSQLGSVNTLADSLRLLGAGMCIGIGSIGPSIGLAHFAKIACASIGINRNAYNKILSFTFLSEAIIETPIIFALVISILLLLTNSLHYNTLMGIAMLSAGMCMGIGTFGPSISSSNTSAAACHQIAITPEKYSLLTKLSLIGQGLIDTSAIYALLISLLLIITSRYW
jgi:F-type H+-transporting ATPase subunit c